jgi:pyrroloquinoline quinone biosynthesis protein D
MSTENSAEKQAHSAEEPASPVSLAAKPAIGRGFRLQWEPAQNAHVLLYPEGMVKLNGSAGEILKRCDGSRAVAAIIEDLEQAFNAPNLTQDVTSFMAFAVGQKWLELRE